MSKVFPVITVETRGVDGFSDPRNLGTRRLRHSLNMQFQNGRFMTRPAFEYLPLGLTGRFQGATLFRPSLGTSYRPFAPCGSRLALAVNGKVYVNDAPDTTVGCRPMELKVRDEKVCPIRVDVMCTSDVNLFQAENYLVIQSFRSNTMWWDGTGFLTVSNGMVAEQSQSRTGHSHDTFQSDKHKNQLINGAGLGIYWNGRIHQQGERGIFVSDLLHKRGTESTDDILLMEEQSLAVCGPPLSTSSEMGALLAIEGLPKMDTPYGQGALIGYYEGGIVAYNTWIFPRASRFVEQEGGLVRAESGWDTKQMVTKNCNVVTATGRYAVCSLPRNHFFRSGFGVHILSEVLGVEYIRDEPVNIISDEVSNILELDDPDMLHGAAAGCWHRGHRWFVTTGFAHDPEFSSSPAGKAFVSWNKTWAKTEDKTPLPAWEGAWVVDRGMFGIHKFSHTGMRPDKGLFGFIASDNCKNLYFAAIREGGVCDYRDGVSIPIPWAFETGRLYFGDYSNSKELIDGRIEGLFHYKTTVRVYVRTQEQPEWTLWRNFTVCDKKLDTGDMLSVNRPLGQPNEKFAEGSWFELRVEGSGAAEITGFEVEVSTGSAKMDEAGCKLVSGCKTRDPLSLTI